MIQFNWSHADVEGIRQVICLSSFLRFSILTLLMSYFDSSWKILSLFIYSAHHLTMESHCSDNDRLQIVLKEGNHFVYSFKFLLGWIKRKRTLRLYQLISGNRVIHQTIAIGKCRKTDRLNCICPGAFHNRKCIYLLLLCLAFGSKKCKDIFEM